MLNLLPTEQKKKITLEYRLKVLWLGAFLLSVLFVIALVGILPSYVNEKLKVDAINQQKEALEKEQNNPANIALVKKAEANRVLARYLQKQIEVMGSSTISSAIQKVLSKKTSTVKIDTISFREKKLVVSGVADNRNELTSFFQSLKVDGYFTSATLPLSSIAKSVDNNFTIELVVK